MSWNGTEIPQDDVRETSKRTFHTGMLEVCKIILFPTISCLDRLMAKSSQMAIGKRPPAQRYGIEESHSAAGKKGSRWPSQAAAPPPWSSNTNHATCRLG